MFSNLGKGSVLYGLDTKGDMQVFTAPVESVSMPRAKNFNPTFGQMPELVVDIVATVNGERREFRQLPHSNTIADFGPDSIVLADSKESLINHIRNFRQQDQAVVDSYPLRKERIPKWDRVLSEIDPASASDTAVKELGSKVSSMESQMAEILSLLKAGNNKPTV